MKKVKKIFKYRLYPNEDQRKSLYHIFNFCRFLYNSALDERRRYYRCFGKTKQYKDQADSLLEIKSIFPEETSIIYSQTLQQVLKQLNTAYENFFRMIKEHPEKKPGLPRFKGRNRFNSILFPQVIPDLSRGCVKLIDNKKVRIPGIEKPIKIKYHRPFEGIAKQCRILKKNDNFYLCVVCNNVPKKPLRKTGKTVGIDLGLNSFVTTDDGRKFKHPKPYKTSLEKLRHQQRKLAKQKKGSNNRKKQKKLIAKTNEKIANQRADFQHKLANKLIRENDKIVVEDLNIEDMLENNESEAKNSNIQDAGWGKFVSKLIYKAESAGREVILVNPKNTSKTCSNCGNIKKELTLTDREYNCNICNFTIDRDVNAAINIKKLGTSFAIP